MKKVILHVLVISLVLMNATANVTAQGKTTEQAAKEKQNEIIHQTLLNAGANEGEAKQFVDAYNLCATKLTEVEKDTIMTPQQKEQKSTLLNEEKNKKYKDILGVERYREYNRLKNLPLEVQTIEKKNRPENETLNTLKSAGITGSKAQLFAETKRTYMDKIKELTSNQTLSKEQKKKQMKDLVQEKNLKYKQVLGADKYHEYNRIKKIAKDSEAED